MEEVMKSLENLINKYKFNIDVLSELTGVKAEKLLSKSKEDIFTDTKDFVRICNIICMLDLIGEDSADFKVGAFLQVLIDYHNITAETIALMSGVKESDVNNLLNNPDLVSSENKFNISKTVMSLRFFLKELEDKI